MLYDIDPNFDIGEFTTECFYREDYSEKYYCDILAFFLTTLIIVKFLHIGFKINNRVYCSPSYTDKSLEIDKLYYLMYPDEFIEFQQYNYEDYNEYAPHSIVPEVLAIKKLESL